MNALLRTARSGPEPLTGGVSFQAPPVILTLPCPPSVNDMFRNTKRGRAKTRAYVDWLGHAGWALKEQKPGHVGGPVVVVISIERASLAADIDNRCKAIFDLLVTHKVMDDDKNVVGFAAAWAPPSSKLARVMVLPAANLSFDFQLAKNASGAGWFLKDAPQPEGQF